MDRSLSQKVVFADHNLVSDDVFAEMNVILCRNVLIYFNKDLQNQVSHLFYKSLSSSGYLCLGTKESLQFTQIASNFNTIDTQQKIYKKKIN
jgi:chemotaxis protein methyltransferase CheR